MHPQSDTMDSEYLDVLLSLPSDLFSSLSGIADTSEGACEKIDTIQAPTHESLAPGPSPIVYLTRPRPNLLSIPFEIRQKILQELLSFDKTITVSQEWRSFERTNDYDPMTSRNGEIWPPHRYDFMLSTGLKTIVKANLQVAVLRCCKQLHIEGRYILRYENRFFGLADFLEQHPADGMLELLTNSEQVPCWRQSKLKPQCYHSHLVPWALPVNTPLIVARLESSRSDLGPYDTLLFPMSCVETVCRALSHQHPKSTHDGYRTPAWTPHLGLVCCTNLSPTALSRNGGFRNSQAFMDTLLPVLIAMLGRSLRLPPPLVNGDQCLDHFAARFIGEIKLRISEGQEVALHRALRTLHTAWEHGERTLQQAGDPECARKHFYTMKEMYGLIRWDPDWSRTLSTDMIDCLEDAYLWASLRIGLSPIANEANFMRASKLRGNRLDVSEASWSMAHLGEGVVFPEYPCEVTQRNESWEWESKLHLRRAELGFILGRPMRVNIMNLVFATFFLAPASMYDGGQVFSDYLEVLDWVLALFWGAAPTTPLSEYEIQCLAGAKELEDQDDMIQRKDGYWQSFWDRMRNGIHELERETDRQCFLDKWSQVKELVEERYGKIGKCSFDFSMLLQDEDTA